MQIETNYSFLREVAKDLLYRYGDNISGLKIVLPTRRAELFFTSYLSGLLNKPIWQPEYISFEKITALYSDLVKADNFTLLTNLYKIYRKYAKTDETFNHFYFWGEMMLSDFDSVDRYLVDAEMLFRNLLNQKELEGDFSFFTEEQISYIQSFWGSFSVEKDNLQNKFIEIWDILYPIYMDYRKSLQGKGLAYGGMIFREMAENMDSVTDTNKYVFVGFNILSTCEKKLFTKLKKEERADFYWDYDEYYTENRQQEAGYFIRENLKEFPLPESFNHQSSISKGKDVSIISAPSEVLQAKLIPTLLKEMGAEYNNRTAIVLTDESLLIPCLYTLPKEVEEVNVTLGYPLANTPVFSLVELLLSLQLSYKEFSGRVGFYYKPVLELLQHKYIRAIANEDINDIINSIHVNNKVYIDGNIFRDETLKDIFRPLAKHQDLIIYINKILVQVAYSDFKTGTDEISLRKEYIFTIRKELNKLQKSIEEEQLEISIQVIASLIKEAFRKIKVPFEGEPIKGLQIMGLKETRTLDFDNVILLSANEDLLPNTSRNPSLIPYNLRKAYNLPNVEQLESITAYYFYRLLQSTKSIKLVYSSKSNENISGEMSRYLYQVKYELPYPVNETFANYTVNFSEPKDISVEKTDDILKKLNKYIGENALYSLSPSSIATYLTCPLQFYFSKIAGIKPKEKVQEEIPVNVLGNILHEVMEEIYKPYINNIISWEMVRAIMQNKGEIKKLIEKAFSKNFYNSQKLPDDFKENGKLLIASEVIFKYILGVLLYDYRHSGFLMISSEKRYKSTLPINVDGKTVKLSIGGIIDRIDRYEGCIRIIDYKTGAGRGVNKRLRFNGVESLFSNDPEVRNKEVLQTLIYSIIYAQLNSTDELPYTPALYFVRDSYSKNFSYNIIDSETGTLVLNSKDYIPEVKQRLIEILEELFNKNIPFSQTCYPDNCRICNYKVICNR